MNEITGIKVKIAAPAGRLWDVIASIGGVDQWSPVITSCRVEGSGAGAKRFCTMSDGTKLKEVVDEIDNSAMRFSYSITQGLPVEDYQGTLIVKPVDHKSSEVTWYSAYAAPQEIADGFRRMIRDALTASLKGLEEYCRH